MVAGICEGGDKGVPIALENTVSGDAFRQLAIKVTEAVDKRNSVLPPTAKVDIIHH